MKETPNAKAIEHKWSTKKERKHDHHMTDAERDRVIRDGCILLIAWEHEAQKKRTDGSVND